MDFTDKKYVVGIDLGTTNCAVSYVDVSAPKDTHPSGADKHSKKNLIKVFNIPQLTGHGEFTRISVLPSFLYLPGEYDISKEVLKHPWKKRDDMFAGSFARDHGSKIPSRLVSSAKSWLCNPKADRRSKILPWGTEGIEKVSPVVATSEYLLHIKNAWNNSVKEEDSFLENQYVVITVPASFNEEARELTMEAVKIAGLSGSVTLLEEPLAAFYSWLIKHETDWHKEVNPNELIFICDVGGGTTDFSLISLKQSQGTPRFERIAVGEHLILGGDNIDLELAKIVEAKFKSKTPLTDDKWKTLCHRCREAKEKILENKETRVRITLKGEGRSLIAGTLAADLTQEDVETALSQKFYPAVESKAHITVEQGKEIADFGLPFEKDSAVTRHIIRFLENNREEVKKQLGRDPFPDYILFNGGTLKPESVQNQIISAIQNWFGKQNSEYPKILENKVPDLAVGIGASYYGLVKQGEGVKVGSGSPRNYYLGIRVKEEETPKAMCLVERGLDEGSQISLPQMQYEVLTNQPVSFDVYSSSYRSGDTAGDIINIDDTVVAMTPIQTVIKFGKKAERKMIPVSLGAEYTEMGTLVMYCQSGVSNHRWELQFQLRDETGSGIAPDTEVYEDALIENALAAIQQAFKEDGDSASLMAGIVKKIETIIGQKKAKWPLSFLRKIADELLTHKDKKGLSAEHESRWLNLAGYCMRPGFGDAMDSERIKQLWKIYLSGLIHEKAKQNRLEWWIFIRRVAAGFNAGQQRQIFQDVSPQILKQKKIKLSPQEHTEFVMAVGNLERLLVKDKIALAKEFRKMLNSGKAQTDLLWALSRLGSRELLYGSVDRVVPAKEAMKWINQMLQMKWKNSSELENMIAQISRMTGDRTRDIDEADRNRIIEWLEKSGAQKRCVQMVAEKRAVDLKEQRLQYGERLPTGLVLKNKSDLC